MCKMKNVRFQILGKVTLFTLIYTALSFLVVEIACDIFPGNLFYEQLPVLLLLDAVCILVLVLFIKVIDKENLVSFLNLSFKNHAKEFFIGGIFGAICILTGFLIIIKLNWDWIELSPNTKIDHFFVSMLYTLFYVILSVAMSNGYILRKLTAVYSVTASLLIGSAVYTFPVFFNSDAAFGLAVNLFLLGILSGMLYLTTQNLWITIGFNFSWMYIQSILGFYMGGWAYPSVFLLNFEEMTPFGIPLGFDEFYVCTVILTISIIISFKYLPKTIKWNNF